MLHTRKKWSKSEDKLYIMHDESTNEVSNVTFRYM